MTSTDDQASQNPCPSRSWGSAIAIESKNVKKFAPAPVPALAIHSGTINI